MTTSMKVVIESMFYINICLHVISSMFEVCLKYAQYEKHPRPNFSQKSTI